MADRRGADKERAAAEDPPAGDPYEHAGGLDAARQGDTTGECLVENELKQFLQPQTIDLTEDGPECPVCGEMLPAGTSNRALNAHVDACLNPPKKKKREIKDWFQRPEAGGTGDDTGPSKRSRQLDKAGRGVAGGNVDNL